MASYTIRLGLRKPDYPDPENVALDINNSLQLIDDMVNCYVGISGIRPLNATSGQLLYETDTENIYILDGANWILLGSRKSGKGRKAFTTVTASGANFTNAAEVGPHLSTSFTAEAGRKYLVEASYQITYMAGDSKGIESKSKWRWAAGAAVTSAGTLIIQHDSNVNGALGDDFTFYKAFEFFPNVAGQVTIGLFLQATVAGDTGAFSANATDRNAYLLVRDWGI